MRLVAALVLAFTATPAHAWTTSSVRTVSAHLVVGADARAEITLVADVHVEGGWLSSFEIDGLDPALELVPERPATFEDALGVPFAPAVEHRGEGRVVWSFPRRRDAPRHGDYVAGVTYRTALATEPAGEVVRLAWTLPAWRYGLDDVSITIDAPPGVTPILGEGDEASVSVTRVELDAGERVVLRRVHLPRTREWPITLEIPASRLDPALATPRAIPVPPPPRALPEPAPDHRWALVLALALIALGRIAWDARGERAARLPSARVPAWARALVVALLAPAAMLASGPLALGAAVGVALLAVPRRPGLPRAARLGAFRPATAAELRAATRARTLASLAPVARAPAVAAVLALAYAARALAPVEELALAASLAVAIVLARAPRVSAPLVSLGALARLALGTRADLDDDRRWALRPVVHADVRGELQDARLRVILPAAPKGLLRIDVVRASGAERARVHEESALLVVTREGSPADRALEERAPGTVIERAPRRVARQLAVTDLARTLAPLLEALAACPVEHPPARETPAPSDLAATG